MPNKEVVFKLGADITNVKSAVEQISHAMEGVTLPKGLTKDIDTALNQLSRGITDFESKKGTAKSPLDFSKALTSGEKVVEQFEKLKVLVREVSRLGNKEFEKLIPPELTQAFDTMERKLNEYSKEYKQFAAQKEKIDKQLETNAKRRAEKEKALNDAQNELKDATKGKKRGTVENRISRAQDAIKAEKRVEDIKGFQGYSTYRKKVNENKKAGREETYGLTDKEKTWNRDINKLSELKGSKSMPKIREQLSIDQATIKQWDALLKKVQAAQTALQQFNSTDNTKELQQELTNLGVAGEKSFGNLQQFFTDLGFSPEEIQSVETMAQTINNIKTDTIKEMSDNAQGVVNSMHGASAAVDTFDNQVREDTASLQQWNIALNDANAIKSRIASFFQLTSAVQLGRRAISDAFQTVKELDAVMAEAAVVTDFSIGDMWEQLPQYTESAMDLGVAIKDVYEATTLYYQMGLKTKEAAELATETMKMARIAGLDAAEAADRVTAAIKGFNMEMNKASGQRVSDVYSELAAISASDVDELSTAMSKTASIANSANMEFETTSAMLAQIIETTREAPETAGTALKTVIARFNELKKAPSEIGEIDGEIVDANAIETALRSVGIALRGLDGQLRDTDDVFMDLSKVWNTLDTNTQHYIATLAAGSRQQSRFIALLSDNERLQELVNAAYNSSGASQKQYEKTLDSLQTKLAKLKDAYDTFTSSITNSTVIKGAIDALTAFLDAINKIIAALSGSSSVMKTYVALLISFGGFQLGKALAKQFTLALENVLANAYANGRKIGEKAVEGVKDGVKQTPQQKVQEAKNRASEKFRSIGRGFGNRSRMTEEQARQDAADQYKQSGLTGIQGLPTGIHNYSKTLKAGDTEAANKYADEVKELSNGQINLQKNVVSAEQAIQDQTAAMNTAAAAAGALGMVFTIIGGALKNAGYDEAAEVITSIGEGFMVLSIIVPIAAKVMSAAGWSVQSAWWPILVIGLAIMSIMAAIKVFQKTYKTAAMVTKELEENASKAAEQLENANKAMENLFNARSEYKDLQKQLEDITYGTQEWKQALLEVNTQVLKLIDTYPELMKYVGQGEYGQLTISTEGWDAAIRLQQERVRLAQSNSLSAQGAVMSNKVANQKYNVEREQKISNFKSLISNTKKYTDVGNAGEQNWRTVESIFLSATDNTAQKKHIQNIQEGIFFSSDTLKNMGLDFIQRFLSSSGPLGKIVSTGAGILASENPYVFGQDTYSEIEDFTNALKNGEQVDYKDLSKNLGVTTEEAKKLVSEFQDLQYSIQSTNNALLSFEQQTIKSSMSEVVSSSEFADDIASYLAKDYLTTVDNKTIQQQQEESTLKVVKKGDIGDNEKFQALAESVGANIDLYEKADEKRKQVYAGIMGIDAKDVDVSKDVINKTIAQALVNVSKGELSTQIYDYLNTLSGTNKSRAKGLISDGGRSFTAKDIAYYSTGGGDIVADAEAFGEAVGLSQDMIQRLKNGALETLGAAQKELEGTKNLIKENFAEYEGQITYLVGDLSVKAYKEFSIILTKLPTDSIGTFLDNFNTAFGEMSQETREKVVNLMDGVDFIDQAQIDSLKKSLIQLVPNVAQKNVDEFIKQMSKLADAVYKVDFSTLIDYLTDMGDLIAKINSADSTLTITEEEYKNLTKYNSALQKSFIPLLEGGYAFIGVIDDLKLRLGVTLDALSVYSEELTNTQIAAISKFANNNGTFGGLNQNEFINILGKQGEEGPQKQQIIDFLKIYQGSGLNLSDLLGEDYASLNSQQIADAVDEAFSLNTTKDDLIAKIRNMLGTGNQNQIDQLQGAMDKQKAEYDIKARQATYAASAFELFNGDSSDWDSYAQAIQAVGKSADISSDYILAFTAAINSGDKATAALIGQQIVAMKDYQEFGNAVNEVSDDWKQWMEELSSTDNIYRQQTIIQEMVNSLEKATGTTLTTQIFEQAQAWEEWGKVVEGDEEAWKSFAKRIYKTNLSMVQLDDLFKDGENINLFRQKMSELTFDDMGNVTEPIADLADMFQSMLKDGVEMTTVFSRLGFTNFSEDGFATLKYIGALGNMDLFSGSNKLDLSAYDWLYNLVQHINKEIRLRNKLEKENEKTLRAEGNTVKEMTDDLLKNNKARLDSLATERAMQERQLQGRKREAEILMDVNSQFKKYAWFDQDRNEVQIDYDAIVNSGMSADSKFSEYFSYLEDLQSKVESCEDALYDIDDEIYKVRNEGKDEFMDIEERLIQAIKEARQKEIDKLQTINDSIKDTNADLLNKVQEGVDEYRDAREKDKQLENIHDLEEQLALYSSDTSGASYLSYLDTQDSLDEARQNYTDSLIDKSISEMTRQNEEAANQRQMQIDLMQATLEYDYEVGNLAEQAKTLMGNINGNETEIKQYLKNAEGRGAMGFVNGTEWEKTLDQGLSKAQTWKSLSSYQGQIKQNILDVTTGGDNSLKTALEKQFSNIGSKVQNIVNALSGNTTINSTLTKPGQSGTNVRPGGGITTGSAVSGFTRETGTDHDSGGGKIDTTKWQLTAKTKLNNNGLYYYKYIPATGIPGGYNATVSQYATGGLNTTTGPAWLDGTRARPEYVLNADQTQAFLKLTNALTDTSTDNKQLGNNYYNIEIQVDKLENDYDVDQLAGRIEERIISDANYRNTVAVDLRR